MIPKIADRHLSRQACIYIRQSTLAQVRFNQESTERQYNLMNKARSLGWRQEQIRVLDRDLGKSGAAASTRTDFKTLVGDVAMGHVGAIFSLEASRLARSNQDWHRLLELCAITGTVVIDEDGVYDPADFNDGLVLGMKGTFAQAELHIIRARLHGGKLNKASRGDLRFALPVGLIFDEDKIVLDPDREVQGAVRTVFELFAREGSAFAVVQRFQELGLRFPRRAYGGAWNGKLIWGRLTHSRVLGILANPSYAGTYVFGRYQSSKQIGPSGEISTRSRPMPQEAWRVTIRDHHEGYINWDQFVANRRRLASNRTNGERLAGPAREGLCLLQGLLVCGVCGRRLGVRYTGNGGTRYINASGGTARRWLRRPASRSQQVRSISRLPNGWLAPSRRGRSNLHALHSTAWNSAITRSARSGACASNEPAMRPISPSAAMRPSIPPIVSSPPPSSSGGTMPCSACRTSKPSWQTSNDRPCAP